ncbi:MAG: neutral/alkaline non-lysosomal ceramidase N-terminal domain-containing protein [Candidatus Helarchaeota archaeon]|nr:neutral/alkaline non-lysosomal ceramidase N-terminal domain-containing protein [Candidatus Helarchaeota archaeon]
MKITPQQTHIPMGGYYIRYSTGVHDDIYVRTLYMATAGEEIFIIACDLLSLYGKFVNRMRNRIYKHTDVKEKNILICALHDHSAPDTLGLEGVRGFLKYTLSVDWFRKIEDKIVKSAIKAKKNAILGKIGVKTKIIKQSEKLVINRRHPRRELRYPFTVWKITSDNSLKASLINYACHGTTLNRDNRLISAEYPGYLIRMLEKKFEPHFSMYLNGPCGDINPYLFPEHWNFERINFDAIFKERYGDYNAFCNYDHTKRIGERLADHAIQLLPEIVTREIEKIQVFTKEIEIPVSFKCPNRKFTDILLTFLLKRVFFKILRAFNRTNVSYFSYVKKNRKTHVQSELQLIKINDDILIVAIPAEVFSEIGEELIEKSPIKNTIIVELANDYLGYIFSLNECKYGGYEVTGLANLAGILPGTYIKNTILKMYEKLTPA